MGVMAFMGIIPTDVGNTLTNWHNSATTTPASIVQGISTR